MINCFITIDVRVFGSDGVMAVALWRDPCVAIQRCPGEGSGVSS